jgi:hypothetical protein
LGKGSSVPTHVLLAKEDWRFMSDMTGQEKITRTGPVAPVRQGLLAGNGFEKSIRKRRKRTTPLSVPVSVDR